LLGSRRSWARLGWMRSLTASSGTKLQGITEHRAAPEQE
jgi:hypothetical protein